MANYVGVDCPICNAAFTADDDIVVCPICGAPHHRTCYQKNGVCAHDSLHLEGYTWVRKTVFEPTQSATESSSGESSGRCPSCGLQNPENSMFCCSCGSRLGETSSAFNAASVSYTSAFGGISPNEVIAGVSARDLAIYVGSGSHYFLPRFREIAAGTPFSVNLCGVLNFAYLLYRKMYFPGGVLLALFSILQIPSIVYAYEFLGYFYQHLDEFMVSMDVNILMAFTPTQFLWTIPLMNVAQYIIFTSSILLMLFGNKIYLTCAIKDIQKIKKLCSHTEEPFDDSLYSEKLSRRGRTSFGLVLAVIVGLFIVSTLISVWMTLPYLSQMP